jgi:hypothetical protein
MRAAVVGVTVIVASWAAIAAAATCTVTDARVLVKDAGFVRPLPEMVGYALPVEVTESTGALQFDFTNMPDGTFSISGVGNAIAVSQAGVVAGALDANGHASLTPMPIDFTTALLPGVVLSAQEFLTTGIAAVTLAGNDYATIGAPLDFATGALHIEGQGLVMNAPVVGTATSGFAMTCTLAPIPAQANLPTGTKLTARGTGKPGKPGDAGTVVGDNLVVKAKLKNGATPLDPTEDVFVRIALGDTEVVLVRAPAGSLTQKGKKFSASDTDGSVIHLITGRKMDGGTLATVSGSLVLVQSKKGITLTLKQAGADLSPLSTATSAVVTISIGPQTATDSVTVKPGAKKTVLK